MDAVTLEMLKDIGLVGVLGLFFIDRFFRWLRERESGEETRGKKPTKPRRDVSGSGLKPIPPQCRFPRDGNHVSLLEQVATVVLRTDEDGVYRAYTPRKLMSTLEQIAEDSRESARAFQSFAEKAAEAQQMMIDLQREMIREMREERRVRRDHLDSTGAFTPAE